MAKKPKASEENFGDDLNIDLMLPDAVDFDVENPIICTVLRSGTCLINDDVRGYTIVDAGGVERTVWHCKALYVLTQIETGVTIQIEHTDTKKMGQGKREMKIFTVRKQK